MKIVVKALFSGLAVLGRQNYLYCQTSCAFKLLKCKSSN